MSETSRSRVLKIIFRMWKIPRVFRDRSRLKTTKSAPFREAHGTTLVVFRPILNEETLLDDLGTALAFEAKESCEVESLTVLIFLRLEKFFFKKLFPARLQRVRQVVSASLCSESLFFLFFFFCGACVYVLSASRVQLSLLNMIIILLKFLDALDMTTRKLVC